MPADEFDLARDLLAFGSRGHEQVEGEIAEEIRDRRVPRGRREQPVAGSGGAARVEAQPLLQLRPERRIGHLGVVAGHHQIAHPVDRRPFGDEYEPDARHLRRPPQPLDVGGGQGTAVIESAGRLPPRNGVEQRVRPRRALDEAVAHAAVRPHCCLARAAGRCRGDGEVLGRAAEADEKVMVVGIDDRRRPRRVGQDLDAVLLGAEPPRLGVVAVRRQRRIADEIVHARIGRQRRAQAGRPVAIVPRRPDGRPPAERTGAADRKRAAEADEDVASVHGTVSFHRHSSRKR